MLKKEHSVGWLVIRTVSIRKYFKIMLADHFIERHKSCFTSEQKVINQVNK